jgi:hypothetical protein
VRAGRHDALARSHRVGRPQRWQHGDGVVDIISEGHWRRFDPPPTA